MSELICKYSFKAPKPDRTYYGSKTLEFPMPENELNSILSDCGAWLPNVTHHLYDIKWKGDSYVFEGSEMGSCGIEEIYDLNNFTQRLSGLNDTERLKLYGLYEHDSDRLFYTGKGGPYHPDLVKCINMTYNIDRIKIDKGIATAAELGKALVETGQLNGFEDLPEEVTKYLDHTKIGKDFCEENNGVFVKDAFVYNIPLSEQLQTPYQGKPFEQTQAEENTTGFGSMNM